MKIKNHEAEKKIVDKGFEKQICFSCFAISDIVPKGMVAYCPNCKEVVMHRISEIDETIIGKIKKEAVAEARKEYEDRFVNYQFRDYKEFEKHIHKFGIPCNWGIWAEEVIESRKPKIIAEARKDVIEEIDRLTDFKIAQDNTGIDCVSHSKGFRRGFSECLGYIHNELESLKKRRNK